MELTPSEHAIDWSGARPAPDLDAATTESRDLLYQAIDARLTAMPVAVPMTTPQPDAVTLQVVNVGILAIEATNDPLAADALSIVVQRVMDLHEQGKTTQMMLSASLALAHGHHRRVSAEQEARRAA